MIADHFSLLHRPALWQFQSIDSAVQHFIYHKLDVALGPFMIPETHTHAPAHMHSPPGHTFSIIQFMIIFSTVVNQFQIPADTNRLTNKWIHAAHIQQSVYIDNHLTHMTHTYTHTIPHPSSTVVAGNDSIHHWRLYEWNKCLCAGWNRLSHISLAWQGT